MPADRNARLAYSTEAPDQGRRNAKEPRPAPAPADRATAKGVRLWLDRRASGRVVTVVTGLRLDAPALAAFLAEMKTACGTGGTAREGAIELQGDHRGAVERALAARGIRSRRAGG